MPKLNRKYKKNRLSSVEVSEVSLVDSPANLQPFLLYKRDGGEPMKIEKDKSLEVLEKASEAIDTTLEKFGKEEKIDVMVLAKEMTGNIAPLVNFCADTILTKAVPQNLAEDKKTCYNSFVKWNVASGLGDPDVIVKQWTDWQGGTATITYPFISLPAPEPAPVKKREEMTEEEFAVDFKEAVEIVKAGKKLSKKNVDLIKNAISTLQAILQGLEKIDAPPEPKPEDDLAKEIEKLTEEQKKELEKQLTELNEKLDSMAKK